jgi:hypothetical protein
MKTEPESRRLDVVFLGAFNPKIFSPTWMAAQGFIGFGDAEKTNVEIIHNDVAVFNLDWCNFIINRERFSVFTEQEPYFSALYDLVDSIFSELSHTPINSLGYNWGFHYKCKDEDDFLVPQNPWRGIFKDSGLAILEVTEKPSILAQIDPMKGKKVIRVRPSKDYPRSVFFNVNDHYELADKKNVIGCSEILETFRSNWKRSKQEAEEAIRAVIEEFEKGL